MSIRFLEGERRVCNPLCPGSEPGFFFLHVGGHDATVAARVRTCFAGGRMGKESQNEADEQDEGGRFYVQCMGEGWAEGKPTFDI